MNRSVLYLCCILLLSFCEISQAQSNSYPKIQNLLDQTNGMRIQKSMFTYGNESLVSQSITSDSFVITIEDKQLGIKQRRYTQVPWGSKFKLYCSDVEDNKKLISCSLVFESNFNENYTNIESTQPESEPWQTSSIKIYLIKKNKVRDEFFDKIEPFRSYK
tara:strand:- start:505 stop:987 length:483 start_codon:yes stop_codon:yes gene_type:complete